MTEAFTALYSGALRDFLTAVDDKTLRTFLGLAAHADARGVCFPGVRELAMICAIPIASVLEGLFALNELGVIAYMRRDQHDPITRRQLPNVYALNPGLLRVSEPLEGVEFITLPIITKKPDRYYPSLPIHKQNQEEQEQSSNKKQLQQPPPEAAKHSPKGSTDQNTRSAAPADKPQNTGGEASPKQGQGNPPSAARREPRSLLGYKSPLGDEPRETLAVRLMAAGHPNLSLPAARMLVDTYGDEVVLWTLADFSEQNTLKNPGGWLRKMVRFNAALFDHEEGNDG